MDVYGYTSSQRPSSYGTGDRRMEIISGNQMYPTPDPVPVSRQMPRASTAKPWGFTDAEMKRKKRVAKYKAYTVEGKVKNSLRNGIRWIKNKCSQIIHGY